MLVVIHKPGKTFHNNPFERINNYDCCSFHNP
jgi:hypothetical protein